MPSSKSSSNSNKTAHVMNLLRKNSPAPASHVSPAAEPPVAEPQDNSVTTQPVTQPVPAPQPAPPVPQSAPIITALNADSEISSQIRDALAEELAQETENEASRVSIAEQQSSEHLAVEPPVSKQSVSHEEPVVQDSVSEKEQISLEEEVPSPVISEEVPQQEPVKSEPVIDPVVKPQEAEPIADTEQSTDRTENMLEPKLVNVMYRIVEDKADKYIRIFGVCPCSQCRNDVIALALNHLPPKYVVMNKAEYLLKSDMYEVRYNCEIVAQLMSACQQVKENPRHE